MASAHVKRYRRELLQQPGYYPTGKRTGNFSATRWAVVSTSPNPMLPLPLQLVGGTGNKPEFSILASAGYDFPKDLILPYLVYSPRLCCTVGLIARGGGS